MEYKITIIIGGIDYNIVLICILMCTLTMHEN